MSESHEYREYTVGKEGQLDPQGYVGSKVGGAAGRMIGTQLLGKKGGKAGEAIGDFFGKLSPFSAEPDSESPTEDEMQNVVSVLQKYAKDKLGEAIASSPAVVIGKSLGLFDAGPQASNDEPTEVELQSVVNFLRRAAKTVADKTDTVVEVAKTVADKTDTVVEIAKTAGDFARKFGMLEASAPTAQQDDNAAERQQLIALLRQAMPALTAIAQAQKSGSQH